MAVVESVVVDCVAASVEVELFGVDSAVLVELFSVVVLSESDSVDAVELPVFSVSVDDSVVAAEIVDVGSSVDVDDADVDSVDCAAA